MGKVPIIHFLSTEGIKVDIQFCNAGTIKSSLFVKTCVELNPSVAVVIYWLNRYFKDIMLKDSRNGLFSAYHLNMLALHFFQASTCRMLPRILEICPQLDPNSSWIMPANILKTGKKVFVPGSDFDKDSCSVGEMIVRLIDYYSQLDLQQISIDISGGILERSVDSHNGIISLIDPYFISQSQPRCKPHLEIAVLLDSSASTEINGNPKASSPVNTPRAEELPSPSSKWAAEH
uniref:PAP-associated domain-containing protein n=1 Tax=Heterorhabditis bacteriophora TaxID=37862 RepID=A0A1I7XEY9_HETBA